MTSNSKSPPIASEKSKSFKEFTEKWLQALSLSASYPAAQRIKPMLNDIDSICMQRTEQEQLDAAKRLWDYGATSGLKPLLLIAPFLRSEWRFEDEESFVFDHPDSCLVNTLEDWVQCLGLQAQTLRMVGTINQDDWSEIIRNEAIRLGRPLKVVGSPPAKESLLWVHCAADWDRTNWTFRFDDPSWIVKKLEGNFVVARPPWSDMEAGIFEAIAFAQKNLAKGPSLTWSVKPDDHSWLESVPDLAPMHRKVIANQTTLSAPWFYRVWTCVWPVVYREQNRLRGPCDIDVIRRELEQCFRNVPLLVVWTFTLAKLICQHRLGRGLGICGEFK